MPSGQVDDKRAFEIALTENIARMTLDPIEEAIAFKSYIQNYGWGSEGDIAKRMAE
jgi:ParB family transcriptional regulator, chromosome partitioning protein